MAALVALVALGWSGLWILAARTTASNLAMWLAQEQEAGRNWTCTDHKLGGFPFRIEASCSGTSLQASSGNVSLSGSIREVRAVAQVFSPRKIGVSLVGPLDIETSDQRRLHAEWSSLAVSLTFGTFGLDRARVLAVGPQLEAETPNFEPFSGDAQQVAAEFTAVAGFPSGEPPYRFSVKVEDSRVEALDRVFGNADPATVEANGIVSHLDAIGGEGISAAVENWRREGGEVEFTKARIHKGTIEIGAKGRLDLDPAHRPHGRIEASGSGLETILARYGVPSSALALDGLLTTLLGSSDAPSDQTPPTLNVPLKFENGRVFVGPVQMPVKLQPLY